MTFFVGSPIEHFIPLYVAYPVFSYDFTQFCYTNKSPDQEIIPKIHYLSDGYLFFQVAGIILASNKGRRKARRTKPNDE
jgi:hypothetical protein